jgi:hypothetical protein
MVFYGDLYQEQPIQHSLIFEKPMLNMQTMTHGFLKENINLFELHSTMRHTNEKFIAILNRM